MNFIRVNCDSTQWAMFRYTDQRQTCVYANRTTSFSLTLCHIAIVTSCDSFNDVSITVWRIYNCSWSM